MMRHDLENEFVRRESDQLGTQQGTLSEIKRVTCFLVNETEHERRCRFRGGHRTTVLLSENGAQCLVSPDDFVERLLERSDVERAFKTEGHRNVVEREAGFELFEKPETLLREGKRCFAICVGNDLHVVLLWLSVTTTFDFF